MYEAVFLDEARAAYDALTAGDREEVDRILERLESDPHGDDVTTFIVRLTGYIAGVYDDGHWEVVYRVVDARFIEVVGIARIGA